MFEIVLSILMVGVLCWFALFQYYAVHGPSYGSAALEAFKDVGIAALILVALCVAFGLYLNAVERSRERRRLRQRLAVEAEYQDCRATLLSSGDWLITSRGTGKTVAVISR